jgi:hypothetical protein
MLVPNPTIADDGNVRELVANGADCGAKRTVILINRFYEDSDDLLLRRLKPGY